MLLFLSVFIIHREISCGGGVRKYELCKGSSTGWDWKFEKREEKIEIPEALSLRVMDKAGAPIVD